MKTISTLLFSAASLLLPAAACDRCFSEVRPQPADGVYHVSSELPDKACYWLFLAELRPDEDLMGFLRRAAKEKYVQTSRKHDRESRQTVDKDGRSRSEPNPDAPEVEERGLVLRNPAAPEAWRDIIVPEYRDNMMDTPGLRERYYSLFLDIHLSPQGITARPGEGFCELARASAAPRFWPWSEASAFLAELPQMLFGDPKQAERIPGGLERFSPPMRERIRSGRRMVVLHADKGMPIAPHWECLARMVSIVGGQNMAYYSSGIVVGDAEYERRERKLMGYPEPPAEPRPTLQVIPHPDVEVQPVLDLTCI